MPNFQTKKHSKLHLQAIFYSKRRNGMRIYLLFHLASCIIWDWKHSIEIR